MDNESIKKLIKERGNHSETFNLSLYDISKDTDSKHLLRLDEYMVHDIKRLEDMLELVKWYRLQIANRYNELETSAYQKAVKLSREKHYGSNNKVYYYLTVFDIFPDGSERITSSHKYEGKDRRQAFEDYEKYVKEHPGIIALKEVDKSYWELKTDAERQEWRKKHQK